MTRPSAAAQGYDARWRKLRAAFLARNPRCVKCGARAVDVDHVLPLSQGGTHAWRNLRALCRSCHSRRTRATQTGREHRGCDASGMPLDPGHPWYRA